MLNFFRKKRKKLADENRPLKYFRYAVGEIFLVVIGILIALQINTWNQERISFNDEQVLLNILSIDFTNRLAELEQLNSGRKEAVVAIEQLLYHIDNPSRSINAFIMDSLLVMSTGTYRFNEKFSTMDMLFNSGKINTLSNDGLKYSLSNWPTLVEEMLEEQRLVVMNFHEYVKLLDKYVSLRDVFQRWDWASFEAPEIGPSKMKKDYEGLLKDRSFENMISNKRFLLLVNIEDSKTIISETKKIIEILNKNIK